MALFVDGPACTIGDLTERDGGVLELAASAGISLTAKIRLATDEIGPELQAWLKRPLPAANVYPGFVARLGQVVVTGELRHWTASLALELTYRDAYFSQPADRYEPRWREYTKLTRAARDTVFATGLGIVNDPVRKAAIPALSTVSGPQAGGAFFACVAWVNGAGQEGAASDAGSLAVADGELMVVAAADRPGNAAGYNVYAGANIRALFRQNDTPLPAGGTYTYVPGQATAGKLPGHGQVTERVFTMTRSMLRG